MKVNDARRRVGYATGEPLGPRETNQTQEIPPDVSFSHIFSR